jgi:hypothetical protein
MRLTLEMGWHHMHRALGKLRRDSYRALAFNVSFAELNEKQIPDTAPALNSKFQQLVMFDHNIYEIFASSPGLLVYAQYPKMLPLHISIICTRPFGRIDDVALRRWALLTVE